MSRAYTPRRETVALMADILTLPGIVRVRPIAPRRGQATRLRVTTDGHDGWGNPIYTDMTLPDARAWLASERAAQL